MWLTSETLKKVDRKEFDTESLSLYISRLLNPIRPTYYHRLFIEFRFLWIPRVARSA
jgi:hypothetical protein